MPRRRGGSKRSPADSRPWQFDLGHSPQKKPYRPELNDKQSLLGMPASKDWALLANYSDKTLQRFEDPGFAARVKLRWNEIKAGQLPAMFQAMTTTSASLQQPQLNNFQRWPILEVYVWPNYKIPGSFTGEMDYLNTWLTARIAWMDSQINP